MAKLSLRMTEIIHENLSILMAFCFSRKPLSRLIEREFRGTWKYLEKGLFELPEQRAEKACIELAVFMRLLDDEENLSGSRGLIDYTFGRLVFDGKADQQLTLREVCNKIIHASSLAWDLESDDMPILICQSREPEKWRRAEIDIVRVAAFCGQLIH